MNNIFIALVLVVFFSACGSKLQHIPKFDNNQIKRDVDMLNATEAIVRGAKFKGWTSSYIKAGHIVATMKNRKTMIDVDIFYDTSSYSIKYKDSKGMQYKDSKISKKYSRYIKSLRVNIDKEFSKNITYKESSVKAIEQNEVPTGIKEEVKPEHIQESRQQVKVQTKAKPKPKKEEKFNENEFRVIN